MAIHDVFAPHPGRLNWLHLGAMCCGLGTLCACTAPVAVRAVSYNIHVRLDPATHQLQGQATVTLRREPPKRMAGGTATVEFALNKALNIGELHAGGAALRSHTQRAPDNAASGDEPNTSALLTVHRLVLDGLAEECMLRFDYSGELVQDVQAGEKRGQIHNFLMAAHIGPEGIYLDASGGWYPFSYHDPAQPRAELAAYHLTADPVAGMELVAGASFDAAASQDTRKLVWHSKYPLDGLVLVGGAHHIKEQQVGPIHLALHYSVPSDPQSRATMEKNTDLFLKAAADYLTRYPPLIGPYPYENFTIVENFFSSGFAFPEFTLLNKVLLQMGPRALGHGYLDHEMLHGWWGCGIYVDPTDGNWCEALTSYTANYYGYVLDGNDKGARDQRRNCCVAVSRLKPEEDKPLGGFSRPGGPGRDIGYSKGTMVFHMLAGEIGQDNFWAAVRHLTADYTGKHANWKTLQTAFEQQGGKPLDAFFHQWVRVGGQPQLQLPSAKPAADGRTLDVTISQGATAFDLSVPVRVLYDDGTSEDHVVRLDKTEGTVSLPLPRPARSVLLDPDYHVMRRLSPTEIIPSGATTRASRKLLIVKPDGAVSAFYQRVIEDFSGEPGSKEVLERTAGEVTAAELSQGSVLILGAAVRSAGLEAFLARAACPLKWSSSGFGLDDAVYDQPQSSVLCTVHHPDIPDGGVTIYCGNSEAALGRSDLLGFYRDSLVIFETTSREVDGQTAYESRVVARRDFETPPAVMVSR